MTREMLKTNGLYFNWKRSRFCNCDYNEKYVLWR